VEFKLTCKNKETKASWDYNPRHLEAFIWPDDSVASLLRPEFSRLP